MIQYYVSKITGLGTKDDPFTPEVAKAGNITGWIALTYSKSLRKGDDLSKEFVLVKVDAPKPTHTTIRRNPNIISLSTSKKLDSLLLGIEKDAIISALKLPPNNAKTKRDIFRAYIESKWPNATKREIDEVL